MGRLVKTTPAAQEQQEEKRTVVGTGAHGRLVKTGDVQRTSPAANTAKTPTAQSVYQKALDEAMMKRAAADQKNKERGRKSYNRTHAQEVREITGDKTKKSITPIIKSAAAGYAADMVGAADTLLRAPSGLNYAASQERGEIEASKKNIAAYTERLKAAKTEEERQQWQTLIDRNKRLIEINSKAAGERVKNYQDVTKGAQETLQGTYQKLRKTASDNMEKANEGLTPVGKYLNNVGAAGAQMVADATLGGGSALGPMFLRVFGGNSQEAAEAADKPGMSAAEQLDAQNRALLYGMASGAVSIATEKISNVAAPFKKAFGGGFLDKAIDGAIAKMNGNAAGRLALSFLSEGGEEVIEDIVQPALQTIYNGKSAGQNYSELDAAEILNDFLVGGTLGLLGSGVEGIQRRSAQIETERAAAETTEATPSPEETAPTAQRPAQQQNTMPAQPAVTPESAQGMGEGNLTPTQPNAAQGAAEGKADALDAGKRVNLLEYSNEQNAQKVEDGLKDGTLAVDAKENIYRVNEDQHIDRRDSASVGERSVNAFQFDHPELHSYYADAAAVLQEEMSFAQKGGELIRRTSREAGDDEYIRTKRGVSERIARLLDDEGVRYDDIDRSLSAIIHNHGQENFAAAKRVELLLDDMLTNGYTDIHGQHIAPNEEYIAAKKAIPGADMSERTHEELPIYDMPEGRNGGIDNAGQETRNDAAEAELADAAERSTPGEVNAARALSDGAAERGERRGNGRESERIPREVRNVGGEDGNALTVQQRLTVSGISQFISPREANVPNGASSDNTVTIFDEADWDQELIGAADWAKSKGVKKVTALLGVIKVEKDGKTGRIFGAFNADTGEIFVNAGSVQRSVSETIEHETAHYLAEVARRENVKTFMRDVQSRYSSEEWGKVYDAYFDRYAALTGDYAGMSESDIELYVWEEIMGDAYAEIDQYDEKASRFNREAESALSQSGQESESALHGERALGAVEQGRETAAATERRRGPPEKYSVQRTQDIPYQEQIDAFYEGDLKTVGRSDDIYVTGADGSPDALGLGGKPFFMLKRNLQKITRKEGANKNYSAHGIGEDIIRDLPDMLKDPAMIIVEGDRISVIPGRTVDTAREKAAPLLIGVNPNGSVDGRSAYEIKTMYGREGFADWIGLRAKDSKIIAGNKNKATALLRNVGIKITEPVAYAADLTSAILSQSQGDVKSPTLGDEIHRQIMGEENEPSQMPPGNRVLKSSELQAKVKLDDSSVSDGGGNVKPKTRFSLDEPVEETKTLVAMHNMTEEKLRRTLDIGAWPAPSIAIVKAKDGHTNYGEYSAVFPRETIDPQRSSKNKVYGGDAWTPTRSNARVEYEVDQSKARALEREIDRLSSEFAGGAFQNSSVIGAAGVNEETELSLDDIAERLAKYPAVQAAYLQSKGESLEPVYKEKKFDSLGNDVLRQYIDRVGMQEVARLYAEMETGGRLDESALNAAREVIVDDWAKRNARLLERRAENRDKLIAVQKNRLEDWRIEKFIRNAEAYIEQNGTSGDEVDKEATSAKMYSMIAAGGSWGDAEKTVQQWVRPRLDGMLGKPGIYNGKDPYTENGRKPFKETHWDYTAENIVRAMNNASDRGEGMWGLTGGTLTATSAPQYDSVDAIHADEERLRAESDDVHEKRLRDLDIEIDRVVDDLLRSTKAHSDSEYEERHILEDVLAEAAKGEHSPAAIKRSFAKDGYAIKDGNARSIMRLFDIAAKIPVGYFEAKPQRVVGFDEALAVVAPDDAPGDLLSEMRDAGMNVVEYRAGDDADRLDKINSIKNVRFSAGDEDGELSEQQEQSYEKTERDGKRGEYLPIPAEWKTKLERARTAATNNIKPSGFDSYDAYLDALDKQRAADRAERLRVKSRDEFKGTKALDELGVKIANSAGIYHNAEQLIANDKAAKSIQNAAKRAEQRLGATRQEKTIARDIANGERSMADIPRSVKKSRVLELVDYYTAQKATKTGLLQQQRIEINDALREQARELIGTEAPEINRKGLRKLFDPSKGLVLYHRTPQRIMRALFGWKQGQQINEAVFEPVYENEQERKRFINRMFDEARTFEGADGKKSALNKDESAFAQRLKEGRTVEELVEKSGAAESIRAAAENLKNGAEMKDAAREFSLDKGSRDLARQYADWLQTQDDYAAAKNVDRTKVENAIEKYTELYDKLYAAINDFLVAHGYEPIGFIKGYAPHFQTSEANGKLESALKAIGVDLGSGVGKLPTSIAGLTKSFKPNKRYNPFFQHRRGDETDYDIVKGFETYVDYASDVLYHTDDIMRVRQMANYLRSTFAPEEMKADIDQMEAMRYAPADVKEEYLRDKKKITGDTFLSYEDLTNLMEQYTDEKYRSIEDATEFSDLVSWLDDYANKLAGKQLFEDRAMEREVGREALNGAKKLNRMFARANVAGNLSSALNQTAQLPMIATELGQKYTWRAVGDILRGKTTGMSAFRGESDFLTEKSGIDYIQSTKGEKAIEKLFSPLEKVDTLVSTIAVRGKYRMELDAGKSPKEAMKAADRWARDIMGTRSKGSVPLTFQSKNLIAQMLNMFQVEAANTFEHITQDRLGPGFKEMAAKIGEDKAIKKLASDAIAYMLLAFLLNRLDEDAYGGTPAPFDVLGMGLNAVASGNGLTSSDMLKMITDDVTENIFGERLFDTDPNDMNDEFDGWSAAEDTLYNISNDVPYVRNVAGLMGWGDQTLPMPDIVGAAGKTKDALKNADSAGEFWAEVAKQLVGLAGDALPGGRQAEKTAQGIEAVARGGSYKGSGDKKQLQYPVNSPLEDPFEALRAALFGKNALNESRVYWAEGGKALSASQTALYQELVDSGMSRKKAYETIRDFNDATADLEADKDENGNPVSGSKKEKVVEAINKLPLSRKQKNKLYLSKNYSEKDLGEMPWN
jgi:gas vesicle protein